MGGQEIQAVRLLIKGRVQGVGYRDWLAGRARAVGIDGWVRNRRDGSVEAVLHGRPAEVEPLIAACRRGPRAARVTDVRRQTWEEPVPAGFSIAPTA